MSSKQEKIEGLRLEALRLIDLEICKIQEMIDKDILQAPSEPKQTFDTVSAPKTIEVLQAEKHKLQNLDVVLAVVGTMKAGKSTTINAIVGTEILPNRSTPMTAIPTLIRHTKGQTQPKLVFENHQPLNSLMDDLRSRIAMPEYQEEIKSLQSSDQDLLDVVGRIRSGQPISAEAIGEKAIFDFLKLVNDLVRISDRFDADFPDEQYRKINELPVIEIEFAHLKEMDSCQGRLILLDTPGPNEAGQPHLREVLQEQLRNASAVMAVVDFTQMRSVASEQINKELEYVSEGLSGRMYALVNKFDQHEEGKDKSKDQIFSSIEKATKGSIPAANVFAVSAKRAYLANKARQLGGNAPDVQKDTWAKEFFKITGFEEDEFDDVKRIQKKSTSLWIGSGFSEPLEKIIKVAYANAASTSLNISVKKCSEIADDISNFLGGEESAFEKSTDELRVIVEELRKNVRVLDDCQNKSAELVDAKLKKLDADIKEIMEAFVKNNKKEFQRFLASGIEIESKIAMLEHEEYDLKLRSVIENIGHEAAKAVKSRLSKKSSKNKKKPQ